MEIERSTDSQDCTWTFSREELQALLGHASHDPARINIHCIALDHAGRAAVATDGHRLMALEAKGGPLEKKEVSLVALEDIKRAIKATRAREMIHITPNCKTVRVATPGGELERDLEAHAFPPWRAVVPETAGRLTEPSGVWFNPEYLGSLALISKAVPREEREKLAVRVQLGSATDPAVFTADSPDHKCQWTVVIMPVRR